MRYCPSCGTEVDENAAFCPTCGQAIDQGAETEMPAAPAWPEQTAPPQAPTGAQVTQLRDPAEPARTEDRPQVPPPAAAPPESRRGPEIELPLTMPVMLSGWLIGVGALLGAVGIVISLFDGLNAIELILLLGLIGIAAAVFFSASLTSFPNLRLATLVVALIGFGIAIDRLGSSGSGVGELLLFLGTATAAMGAIVLELGRDQPLGPSR